MLLPLLWVSPFSMFKPPNNPPPSCNRGYLTASPLQNFKKKKKKTKESNTEVTIICNVSQIYVFNYCSKIWIRKMDLQWK